MGFFGTKIADLEWPWTG